jgi:uncharacterized protein (TIGR02145 family)
VNQDGIVGVVDMLSLLSFFGDTDFDFDGVYDSVDLCTDESACNYSLNPSAPCAWLDAIGVCGGWCQDDINEDGICDWECGHDSLFHQGHWYSTVQIGGQCWFKENCRYLPEISTIPQGSDSLPHAYVYGNDGNDVEEVLLSEIYQIFGPVYNYKAVEAWPLCPSGWRIPLISDFEVLSEEFGGDDWSGVALKAQGTLQQGTGLWQHPWVDPPVYATDSSGFSAIPHGVRTYYETWHDFGYQCVFWSAEESNSAEAWYKQLYFNNNDFSTAVTSKESAFSVRCVRD